MHETVLSLENFYPLQWPLLILPTKIFGSFIKWKIIHKQNRETAFKCLYLQFTCDLPFSPLDKNEKSLSVLDESKKWLQINWLFGL